MEKHNSAISRIETSLRVQPAIESWPDVIANIFDRMQAYATPGVSVAVIESGQIAWTKAWGVQEAGMDTPVDARTRFQAGSISKFITALAVMRAVDQGVLDLSADVNLYLHSWKVPADAGWQPRVTLEQLLSHTAGTTVTRQIGYGPDQIIPSLIEILDGQLPSLTEAVVVDTTPGIIYRYSGGGFSILQQLMIDVFDMPFPDLMRELVLGPLEMHDSGFDQPLPAQLHSVAATGHSYGCRPMKCQGQTHPDMASCGLWSTPTDLAKCIIEMQSAVSGRPSTILSPSAARRMLTPEMIGKMGLGINIEGDAPLRRFRHVGYNEGFLSEMIAYEEIGLGAVVMCNSHQSREQLLREIIGAVAAEYNWPDFARASNSPEAHFDELEAFAGRYELWQGLMMEVTVDSDKLQLHLPGQEPMAIYWKCNGRFYSEATSGEAEFIRDSNSHVTHVAFYSRDVQIGRFSRV